MAVQYVKFPLTPSACTRITDKRGPVTIGVDHPAYRATVTLSAATLASLSDDFA